MDPKLRAMYIKLLKWSVTTLFFIGARSLVIIPLLNLVIIGCVGYCLLLFGICVYLQLNR
ncbi:hypothetical protein FD50_GL001464 [Liquorilactobacillus satsumensis DSM 16230 = JCM 12392]|uniref:Uncharacterized protein n=1 Tax=Liquorilactobacillus satsumensis DSM 16230 = JCM 12392 TaxID=1423801 RepID=A0A0R1V2P0_9LACO|nr:hypothetical protein FD50_GL001464 [Liquorilactobacillus satsumensis DSM 16230 = JCM 12392]